MRILTTSGLYLTGSAETILLRLAELADAGVAIHNAEEGCFFLAPEERSERYKERTVSEIVQMSAAEVLYDMEEGGYILIGD